jgi:hypothetical protein
VARDAKKAVTGRCGGRKTYAERNLALVDAAKAIKNRGGRVSLRDVAAELAAQGFPTPSGQPYSASAVQSMLRECVRDHDGAAPYQGRRIKSGDQRRPLSLKSRSFRSRTAVSLGNRTPASAIQDRRGKLRNPVTCGGGLIRTN